MHIFVCLLLSINWSEKLWKVLSKTFSELIPLWRKLSKLFKIILMEILTTDSPRIFHRSQERKQLLILRNILMIGNSNNLSKFLYEIFPFIKPIKWFPLMIFTVKFQKDKKCAKSQIKIFSKFLVFEKLGIRERFRENYQK